MPRITNIHNNGTVDISWSNRMNVISNLTVLSNIDDTVRINDTEYTYMVVELEFGHYTETDKTVFEWRVVNMTERTMRLQLDFEHPEFVGQYFNEPDFLKITFFGFHHFMDTAGRVVHPETSIRKQMVPQDSLASLEYAKNAGLAGQVGIVIAISSNVVINLLFAGSLQMLLGAVKHIQILGHMMLVRLTIPATAQVFFSYLLRIVCLDLIDLDEWYDSVLELKDNRALSPNFSMMDYESLYSIRNYGSLYFIFAIAPTVVVIAWLLKFFNNEIALRVHLKVMNLAFWGSTLSFMNESLLLFCLCGMINTHDLGWDTYGQVINSVNAIVFLAISLFTLFFFGLFFQLNMRYVLKYKRSFREKYFSFFGQLNYIRQKKKAFFFIFFTAVRKVLMCASLVYLQADPLFTVHTFYAFGIFMSLSVAYIKPFRDPINNKLEFLNEVSTLVVAYHLICLTDFLVDLDKKASVANSLILFTVGTILLNLTMVIGSSLIKMYQRAKWKQIQLNKIE